MYSIKKIIKNAGKKLGKYEFFLFLYYQFKKSKAVRGSLPQNLEPCTTFGVFTDSYGNKIELLKEHRNTITPGWEWILQPPSECKPIPKHKSLYALNSWKNKINQIKPLLDSFSLSLSGKEVLEIGAYDGATAYSLAQVGPKKVIATDLAAYYIQQSIGGTVSEGAIKQKNDDLAVLRNSHRLNVDPFIADRVVFLEDDICHSSIPSESVDAIMSWEVLEHVTKPNNVFLEISRILKPGGFAFHEYNPFFSITGGHSPCTLDFPWGHTRLNSDDFEKYINKFRPNESSVALSFYKYNLNRMTLADLKQHINAAGMRILALLPEHSTDQLKYINHEVLSQAKNIYPSVTLLDLISPFVWILFIKE